MKDKPGDMVVFQNPARTLEIKWKTTLAMALFDFQATVTPASWTTYEVALRTFFSFLGQTGLSSPDEVTTTHITSYIAYLRQEKKAPRTIRCYIAAASSFYDFLTRPRDTHGTSIVKSNPFLSVKEALPRIQAYVKENPLPELSMENYQMILATASGQSVLDLRDRAILSLVFYTARRRKEIVRLKVEDFGNDRGVPFVRFLTKGGTFMSIDLTPGIQQVVADYWKASGRTLVPASPAFVGTGKARPKPGAPPAAEKPLAPSSLDRMLKTRSEAAGIDPTTVHVHVHGLRHLAARTLRESGVDLKKIKERLGHSKLDTTDIYLGAMERISVDGLSEFERIALGKPPIVDTVKKIT